MRYIYMISSVNISVMLAHKLQIILNLLYVCQSVSWLTYLRKWDKYRDISSSGWHLFLRLFRDIPRIFLDYFQNILNFLYVCQSVSWLTYLQKLDKYGDISSSVWDIFLKFLEKFLECWQANFKYFFFACMSVSVLGGSLPYWNYINIGISPFLDEIAFWNFLETFLGCWYTISK